MSWSQRLWNVVRRGDVNRDIDEELQFHIDERTRVNIDRGMPPDEARRDAAQRFGSRMTAREHTHDADVLPSFEGLVQDVTFAVRTLRKHPAFTMVAVATLALGIGVNATIFTVVHGVLLRPLPFPDAERLVVVTYQPRGAGFWLYPGLSDRHFLALHDSGHMFTDAATFSSAPVTLTGAGDPLRLTAATVTPDFFRVLRVSAVAGRVVSSEDAVQGSTPVVVLGDPLWRSRFGADPKVIGRRLTLDGVTHTVVGVLPPGFAFPAGTDLWTPLVVRNDPGVTFTRPTIARLPPAATLPQTLAAWRAFAGRLPLDPGPTHDAWSADVIPLKDAVVGDVRRPLLIFTGAVVLVLLIAWANVSNLLLVHTTARRDELAIRLALGASRPRVVRQLLTESALIALLGGIAAALVSMATVPALVALVPPERLPRVTEIRTDVVVVAFTFALAIVSGFVLGVIPALHATHASGAWRGRGTWATAPSDRFRQVIAVAQVALALVLLVSAGLLVRSFLRLRALDPGFQPAHVMTMTVDLPDVRYASAASLQAFHRELLDALSRLPGVIAGGAVNWLPFGDMLIRGDVELRAGQQPPPGFILTKACVTPGYLSAMGLRLARGRDVTPSDGGGAAGVVLVSASAARHLFGGRDALGQQIAVKSNPGPSDWLTVIGIVDDVRQVGLTKEPEAALYQSCAQVTQPFFLSRMSFVVRTAADAPATAAMMLAVLHSTDKDLAPHRVQSMEDVIADTISEPRVQTHLLAVFSAVALMLAAIGVYGVLAAAVADRRREIGIRIALGAGSRTLMAMVLSRVMRVALAGVLLGTAIAGVVSRLLAGLLFEITPTDPTSFIGAAVVLVAVALAAGWLPARTARAIDPIRALRAE